jgi:hypothetical protein
MANLKEILVIGGTGAQGIPIVEGKHPNRCVLSRSLTMSVALSKSNRYIARVMTRDPSSSRSQELAALPNVKLIQGSQTNQDDLHAAFRGVYGAWVNLDGFNIGEKNELFYGARSYEIARTEGVQHFIWANISYSLKALNWDEQYYGAHFTGKGRVGCKCHSTLDSSTFETLAKTNG